MNNNSSNNNINTNNKNDNSNNYGEKRVCCRFKKSILNKMFLKTRKATGGLIFIIVATLSSMTLTATTRLSSAQMAQQMVDNSAYLATFRMATYLYNTNKPSGTYSSITDSKVGISINPKDDYNRILNSCYEGKVKYDGNFVVKWDKNTSTAIAELSGGSSGVSGGVEDPTALQGGRGVKPVYTEVIIE